MTALVPCTLPVCVRKSGWVGVRVYGEEMEAEPKKEKKKFGTRPKKKPSPG